MSLIPTARNGANRPPPRAHENLALDAPKTSTRGKVPTGYAEEIAISEQSFRNLHREVQSRQAAGTKRKRETKGDSGIVYGAGSYKGPWAKYEERQIDSDSGEEIEVEVSDDDEEGVEVVYEEDSIAPVPGKAATLAGTAYADVAAERETTTFEGSSQYDYQGRTYMHVPRDLEGVDLTTEFENLNLKCYHPKRSIHTFRQQGQAQAHDRPVTQLRFFPDSGHLLLSSAADGMVKLWDVYHKRELLRSYRGHSKSVVDVDFSPDGTHFLTASFDRQLKLWDTETGQCTGRYSTGVTPHVARWHPDTPSGGDFIAGMHDNKIVQFDPRAPGTSGSSTGPSSSSDRDRSKPVQTYDHHLGPINTLIFTDENRRFISTSDDKSLRAWDYNIPVPVKLIAEPDLFPLTAVAAHPTKPSLLYQSSDNTVRVYNTSAERTLRANRKKEFRGHHNAGYRISLAVSPDGGIIGSGDGQGGLVFWDWKTCKLWQRLAASDKGAAVAACAWHPRESSKVVSGDNDGVIKYWD